MNVKLVIKSEQETVTVTNVPRLRELLHEAHKRAISKVSGWQWTFSAKSRPHVDYG